MPNQALYDLLLEAIQQEHPREFTESELATAVQRSNPNFRQLSRAPFVDRVEIAKSLKQPDGVGHIAGFQQWRYAHACKSSKRNDETIAPGEPANYSAARCV